MLKLLCCRACTVRLKVMDWRVPPPAPVMVIGYVPAAVVPATLINIVELPLPGAGIGFGLKLTVAPAG